MPLLIWNEQYSVGVTELDDQHRKMIDALNHLQEGLLTKQPPSVIGPLLARLGDLTGRHFSQEERLMAAAGYPDLQPHRTEHGVLLQQIERFKRLNQSGDIALSGDVLDFLKDWLANHILQVDLQYKPWLSSPLVGAGTADNPSA